MSVTLPVTHWQSILQRQAQTETGKAQVQFRTPGCNLKQMLHCCTGSGPSLRLSRLRGTVAAVWRVAPWSVSPPAGQEGCFEEVVVQFGVPF